MPSGGTADLADGLTAPPVRRVTVEQLGHLWPEVRAVLDERYQATVAALVAAQDPDQIRLLQGRARALKEVRDLPEQLRALVAPVGGG
jgi:hypothetical protein